MSNKKTGALLITFVVIEKMAMNVWFLNRDGMYIHLILKVLFIDFFSIYLSILIFVYF